MHIFKKNNISKNLNLQNLIFQQNKHKNLSFENQFFSNFKPKYFLVKDCKELFDDFNYK